MEYARLVELFEDLEETQSTLEKTDILAEALQECSDDELDAVVRFCRGKVFASWEEGDLGVSSSLTKQAIAKVSGVGEDGIEDAWRETGDLGDAAEQVLGSSSQGMSAFMDMGGELGVMEVYDAFRSIAAKEGEGSERAKVDALSELLQRGSPEEARYLVRLAVGAMRLGVGEGIVRDAIADAFLIEDEQEDGDAEERDGEDADDEDQEDENEDEETAAEAVQAAFNVTNDFGLVARTARSEGREGLAKLEMELFRPINAMLAQKTESLDEAFESCADEDDRLVVEYKYDGMRVQIHKDGDEVQVFTRRLDDVSEQFPELVEAVREHVTAEQCVLEGEAVAYDPETGDLVAFQELSRRIKRKYDIDEMVEEIPVVLHLFDVTYLDGETLVDLPLRERWTRLQGIVEPEEMVLDLVAHIETSSKEEASDFYQEALAAGHEGAMLKNMDAEYNPGSRVGYMVKLKPIMETLDLVVVKAEWSEGRKSDWLGRLFIACRDQETGEFRTIGRMSTGYTDEQLAELTERLEPLIQQEDGREVTLEPEVVLEVAYEEIQESPTYGSGYALRFPRFIQVREDIDLDGVDTLEKVESLYEQQGN